MSRREVSWNGTFKNASLVFPSPQERMVIGRRGPEDKMLLPVGKNKAAWSCLLSGSP